MKAEEFFLLSGDLFCVSGFDGFFKKVNPAFCTALSRTEEELLSKPIFSFIHPEDIKKTQEFLVDVTKNLENRYLRPDGTFIWLSWSKPTIEEAKLVYATARDITREKQLELQLSESVKENQKILDYSLDVICTLSKDGVFLSLSKAAESFWGYTAEELIGKSYLNYIHPEDIPLTRAASAALKSGRDLTNFENRYIRKDGTIAHIIWSATWSEEQQTLFCIARDATQRKKQEALIFENERRFRGLIETGADLIAILDKEGNYIYTGSTIEHLGYKVEELLHRSVFDLVHPQDLDMVREKFDTLLKCERVEVSRFRLKDKAGNWRIISTTATNKLDDPLISGIVTNSRDISEQVRIEEERERAVQRTQNLIENITEGYLVITKNWVIEEINPKAKELLGLTDRKQIKGNCLWDLFPDAKKRSFYKEYNKSITEGVPVRFVEYLPSVQKWLEVSAYPYEGCLTIFFKDITESKVGELNLRLEKEVLEMNSNSRYTFSDIINYYVNGLYPLYPDMQLSLHVVNKKRTHLFPLDVKSPLSQIVLPNGDSGVLISPENGACGLAAWRKKNVIAEDIHKHTCTIHLREVLGKQGIKACWSFPVINEQEEVIATLGCYFKEVKKPSGAELDQVNRICTIIKILIESCQNKEHIQVSSERHRLVTLAANDAIYDWDILHDELYWGEGFEKIFGYKDSITKLEWWAKRLHQDDVEVVEKSLSEILKDPDKVYWHSEYRFLKADGNYAYIIEDGYIIRDKDKKAVRMVGAMQDNTRMMEHQQQILKQNELLREIAQINSHYIRKPLANILGLIELVRHTEPENIPEVLALLEKSGVELDDIIRQIAQKTVV